MHDLKGSNETEMLTFNVDVEILSRNIPGIHAWDGPKLFAGANRLRAHVPIVVRTSAY